MMKKKLLRLDPVAGKAFNKEQREGKKAGKSSAQIKTTSSKYKEVKTNSARKPSVPNKIKAQGKGMMKSPTSNFNRRSK